MSLKEIPQSKTGKAGLASTLVGPILWLLDKIGLLDTIRQMAQDGKRFFLWQWGAAVISWQHFDLLVFSSGLFLLFLRLRQIGQRSDQAEVPTPAVSIPTAIAAQIKPSPQLKQLIEQLHPRPIVFQPGTPSVQIEGKQLRITTTLEAINGTLWLVLISHELAEHNATIRLTSIHAIKDGHAVSTQETADVEPHVFQGVRLFYGEPNKTPFVDGTGRDALRTLGQSGGKFTIRQGGLYAARLAVQCEQGHADVSVCFDWNPGEFPRPRDCHAAGTPGAFVVEMFQKAKL